MLENDCFFLNVDLLPDVFYWFILQLRSWDWFDFFCVSYKTIKEDLFSIDVSLNSRLRKLARF